MRLRGLMRNLVGVVLGLALRQRGGPRLAALGLALQKQRNRFVPRHAPAQKK